MLAHKQGAPLNTAELARGLGVDAKTASRYVDLLTDLLLARRLPPWHANVRKRLVKSPRLYLRDSGLVHALLGIADRDALLGHPVVGASWEGFVLENILVAAPDGTEGFFYRTAAGAEIDLLLVTPRGEAWAIDIKRSLSPKPERGFHTACGDVKPARRYLVYPGREKFPLGQGVEAISLTEIVAEVEGLE